MRKSTLTADEICTRILTIHHSNYTFPNLQKEVADRDSQVTIVCPRHGSSLIQVKSILYARSGCKECGVRKPRKYDDERFRALAKMIHGEKYDYSESAFVSIAAPIKIICPDHGAWFPEANNFLKGSGCPRCGKIRMVHNRLPSVHRNLKSQQNVLIEGKVFHTDSLAERTLLPLLCAKHGVDNVEDQDNVPLIPYEYQKRKHLHRPDFFLPYRDILIEVKSPVTLGISDFALDYKSPEQTLDIVIAKTKAAIALGYDYRVVLVIRNQRPIELPRAWEELYRTPTKLKELLLNETEKGFRR